MVGVELCMHIVDNNLAACIEEAFEELDIPAKY